MTTVALRHITRGRHEYKRIIFRYFACMDKRIIYYFGIFFLAVSCYQPQRDCKKFKNGKFSFTSVIDGKEATTIFERQGEIEIDHYQGKSDTSSVRWVNDCEYVVKKLNPKNRSEEKSIEMRILSTTDSTYTFEYGIVGKDKRFTGTAVRIE